MFDGRFGTGITLRIWRWWENFWQQNVENKGLGGLLLGLFPFFIMIIGVVIFGVIDAIVELGILIVAGVRSLFYRDDNEARDVINSSSCDELNNLSNDRIIQLVEAMLERNTGNPDESAILRLFRCLSCNRLAQIVEEIGLENIESEFQGVEADELQVVLGICEIIPFNTWSDDASRTFIQDSSCDTLNDLTNVNIVGLINNMLAGTTGNPDEEAILKILECLPCERLRDVVNRLGVENLISNFGGSQKNDLINRLSNCDIES
jgi:hypothetical protein